MSRVKTLVAITLLLFIASFLKLFQKQILEHSKYLEEARGQQIVKKEILPPRGQIFVKEEGELYPLATNLTFYAVSVIPKHVEDPKEVTQKLAPLLEMDENELFNLINNDKLYLPPLKHKLSEEKAKQIQALGLSGVYLEEEIVRFYPEGEIIAHILGFVNAEGEGQYGLEGFYNLILKGEKGILEGEKDIKGRIISYLEKEEASEGIDLVLTIDRTIQFEAFRQIKQAVEKFKAKAGSILIIDPQTGAIIALANYPSFDPNKYNEIKKEDYGVFTNSGIGKIWEPGSAFKVITMAASIDSGKVNQDTTKYFEASVKIGGYEIWTYDKKPQGKQNMTQVLETSNNVGAVFAIQEVGKELFYDYLKKFGFGSLTGIDSDSETNEPLRQWSSWKDVELATMSFGQGIAVTPIQFLTAVSVIANGGKLIQPHIVDEMISKTGKKEKIEAKEIRQAISPSTASIISEMMVSVIEKGHGKRAGVRGYKVAGKTGTAQIPKKDERGYEEGKSIGSFVGFAPAENPRFVMLVKVDEPQTVEWAESSAAPVFGQMAAFLLNYFQISPSE